MQPTVIDNSYKMVPVAAEDLVRRLVLALEGGPGYAGTVHEIAHALSRELQDVSSKPGESLDPASARRLFEPIMRIMLLDAGDAQLSKVSRISLERAKTGVIHEISRVLGEAHVVLSDLYADLSLELEKQPSVGAEAALEWCGRALLCRMKALGLLHKKTADSHNHLGRLYALLGNLDQSRKELLICRGIYVKIAGMDEAIEIADCDYRIGEIELAAFNGPAAYQSFYQCHRARVKFFGLLHPLTVAAQEKLSMCRHLHGETHISSFEVRDRVQELEWGKCDSTSAEYTIFIFLGSLQGMANYCLTRSQLKTLAERAEKYSFARRNGIVASFPHFSPGAMTLQSSRLANGSPDSPSSSSNRDHDRFQRNENVNRLLALLLNEEWLPSTASFFSPATERGSPSGTFENDIDDAAVQQQSYSPSLANGSLGDGRLRSSSFSSSLSETSRRPTDSTRAPQSDAHGDVGKGSVGDDSFDGYPQVDTKNAPTPISVGTKDAAVVLCGAIDHPSTEFKEGCDDQSVVSGDSSYRSLSPSLSVSSCHHSIRSFSSRTSSKGKKSNAVKRLHLVPVTSETEGDIVVLPFSMGTRSRIIGRDSSGVSIIVQLFTEEEPLANAVSSAVLGKGPIAISIPLPPPLPNSWPPISIKLTVANCMLAIESMNGKGNSNNGADGVPGNSRGGRSIDMVNILKMSTVNATGATLTLDPLATVAGTIWEGESEAIVRWDEIFFDFNAEFVQESARTNAKVPLPKRPQIATKAKIPAPDTVVNSSRLKSLDLMLQRLKKTLSIDDITAAILVLDTGAIDPSNAQSLIEILPTSEEISLVEGLIQKSNLTDDTQLLAKLGQAQYFIHKFAKIVKYEMRVQFIAAHHFLFREGIVATIQASAAAVLTAILDVRGSHRLKYLLMSILQLSNAVNAKSLSIS